MFKSKEHAPTGIDLGGACAERVPAPASFFRAEGVPPRHSTPPVDRSFETRSPTQLVIVCGLSAEVKIARGPGIAVLKGGGDSLRLARELEAAVASARALISFGVAGGLAPGLRPGDMQVASAVVAPDGRRFATDRDWSAAIADRLGVGLSTFVGVDEPLGDVAGKSTTHMATGATTVDMESHIVARIATANGLPFAAVRVITDPAHRPLPHAATVGMKSDGSVDLPAIFRSLLKNPGQLPALIRTGLDAQRAFASLFRCRQRLGPGFAFVDLGHTPLDVP